MMLSYIFYACFVSFGIIIVKATKSENLKLMEKLAFGFGYSDMTIFINSKPHYHGLQGRHRQQGSESRIFKMEDVEDVLDKDAAMMF